MTRTASNRSERYVIVCLAALAVIAVRVGVGNPFVPEPSAVGLLAPTPVPIVLVDSSCARSAYVTADLVGDGNPAEVYAALCPR